MQEKHPESLEAIAERLELLRLALGFETKTAFAAALGISTQRLNSYLTGTPISYPIMLKILQLWRVDSGYIYHGHTKDLRPGLISDLERAKSLMEPKKPRTGQGRA